MTETSPQWLAPDWPAPAAVRAAVTTRIGGVSRGAYAQWNLSLRCGDEPTAVADNRRRLGAALDLPAPPRWLAQIHGTRVIAAHLDGEVEPVADAAWTDRPGVVCAVLAADCLPVLLCDERGIAVAVAHAGWRGLAAGVLEACIAAMPVPAFRLLAWLGPAIGPQAFEVGEDVRSAFLAASRAAAAAFVPAARPGKYRADLWALARQRLERAGVTRISGGGLCTFSDARRFFSHRRQRPCGRQAALIWLAD